MCTLPLKKADVSVYSSEARFQDTFRYLGSVTSILSCISWSTTVAARFFSVDSSILAVQRVTRESVQCTSKHRSLRQSLPKILHIGYSHGTDCSDFEPWECRYNWPWIKTAPLDLCHRFEGIICKPLGGMYTRNTSWNLDLMGSREHLHLATYITYVET